MQTKVLIFDSRCSRFAGIQRKAQAIEVQVQPPRQHTHCRTPRTPTHQNKMRIKQEAAAGHGRWSKGGSKGSVPRADEQENNYKVIY